MESSWPNHSPVRPQRVRESLDSGVEEQGTEVIETPEFAGVPLRMDMDLDQHMLEVATFLRDFPELTCKQRYEYFYESLGFKLKKLFKSTDSIVKIVGTLETMFSSKTSTVNTLAALPWYVVISELKQDIDEPLEEFLTRLYHAMNHIRMGELTAYQESILPLVMTTALIHGLKRDPYEALIFMLKQWARFENLRPEGDLFAQCCMGLFDWHKRLLAGDETAKIVLLDSSCSSDCSDMFCPYDHGIELSWSLQVMEIDLRFPICAKTSMKNYWHLPTELKNYWTS
jgi:hypothetical protein